MMTPFADGSSTAHSLFEAKAGLSEEKPVAFELEHVEQRDHGGVWLRYKVKNN